MFLFNFIYDYESFFLVFYYNFELEDYNVASLPKILDMVKVFAFALSEGKVKPFCEKFPINRTLQLL